VTRARGTEPRYSERHGNPRGTVDGPYQCSMCDAGPYLSIQGLRCHLRTRHVGLGVRGVSLAIDRIRWPGGTA
jgi:hypothetical protein